MSVYETQFGIMPERGTIDAVFIKRMLEKYDAKDKKLHMCFGDIEKTFERVPTECVGMGNEVESNTRSLG